MPIVQKNRVSLVAVRAEAGQANALKCPKCPSNAQKESSHTHCELIHGLSILQENVYQL